MVRTLLLLAAVASMLPGCALPGGFTLQVRNETEEPVAGHLRVLDRETEDVVTEFSFTAEARSTAEVAKPRERGGFLIDVALEDGRAARLDASFSDELRGFAVVVTEDAILSAPEVG